MRPNTTQAPNTSRNHYSLKSTNNVIEKLEKYSTRMKSTLNKDHLKFPGPGIYNSHSSFGNSKSSKKGFGSSTRPNHLTKNEDQPGPANYDVSNKSLGGKLYQFGIKINERYNKNPGPGSYQPNLKPIREKSIEAKIGKSER